MITCIRTSVMLVDAAVDSDDDDVVLSDVPPEKVPDVSKLVRAVREEHKKLLQEYGIHVWTHQQQYHVSFASNNCVITDRDKRENALCLRIRTPNSRFLRVLEFTRELADLLLVLWGTGNKGRCIGCTASGSLKSKDWRSRYAYSATEHFQLVFQRLV